MFHFNQILFVLFSFFLTVGLLYSYYASRIGIRDVPNSRSMHKRTVKKAAGMVFIPVFISLYYFSREKNQFLFYGMVFTLFVGIVDDIFNPGSKRKLFLEFLFFLPFSHFLGKQIYFLDFLVSGNLATLALAFYFVFIINLVNFMDGLDMYLVSTSLVAFLVFSFMTKSPFAVQLMASVLFGFAVFNSTPARLFMGDSGSLPIGFFIAFLPFYINTKAEITAVFFLIPVFFIDGIFTILKRAKNRENILKAHRKHLYQIITESALPKRKTALWFALTNLVSIPFLILDYKTAGLIVIFWGLGAIYLAIHQLLAPRGIRTPTLSSED